MGDDQAGVRPSVQRLLDLIDISDPSWPAVALVLQEFTAAGIELDETTIPLAVKLGKAHAAGQPVLAQPQRNTLASASASIVYYIRRGGLIKIGTTADPRARFRDLVPDEILAVEPGALPEERARHRQFAYCRTLGEYFQDNPVLREHIAGVLALYGPPDPSWCTAQTVETRGWRLPLACSTETMTAAEAAEQLAIPETTIRGWRARGHLPVAGRTEPTRANRPRLLFYREHLIALRDSSRVRSLKN